MSVKLNSTGGGSVTLDSPSTASNYTVTLPSAAGTLATTTGTGSVFTNPTINGFTGDTSAITVGTTQFVKDTSGNIGIGTASPANKVHISGDGSASLLKVQATNTNGTASINLVPNGTGNGQIYTESGALLFSPTNTERMRLDSSGNLGLGVTPNSGWLNSKAIEINGGSISGYNYSNPYSIDVAVSAYSTASNTWSYRFSSQPATLYRQTTGIHSWYNAPSGTAGNAITFNQAMTLDASGRLLLGQTSNNNGCILQLSNSGTAGDIGIDSNATYCEIQSFNTKPLIINRQGNEVRVGGLTDQGAYNLQCNGTGVWGAGAYFNGSDERIKEDIAPIASSLGVISKLNPVTYKYKESWSKDINVQTGFIAQELQVALADEIYLEGVVHQGPEYLSVAYQNLIPILVKAIQELSAQNQALEARLAQLEAK